MMRLTILLLALGLLAPAGGARAESRRDLAADTLRAGPFAAPVDYAAFAPGAGAASNRFRGCLVLDVAWGPAGYVERPVNLFDRQPAISVVLLPHGVQYDDFSDGGGFDGTPAAVQAARIRNPRT